MARPFVSYDGEGHEVWVQKGTGVITRLEDGEAGVSANVKIKVEGLKHLINSWILKEDPLYAEVEEAFNRKEEISFRTESQRKSAVLEKEGLAPDTPIRELRKDLETAAKYTVPIFAGINGKMTAEAVTNPEKDPTPSGRIRDTSPVNSQGQQTGNNTLSGSVKEEAPFRLYNSTGMLNLGSYAVAGTASTESKVREYLLESEVIQIVNFGDADTERLVFYLTQKILEVTDAVQVSVPHLRNKVDRNEGSHTRARSVVYDTMKYLPKFVTEQGNEWLAQLQELSITRFRGIVELTDRTLKAGKETQEEAPNQPQRPAAPAQQEQAGEGEPTEVAAAEEAEPVQFRSQVYIPSDEVKNSTPTASAETIELFKELVLDSAPDSTAQAGRLIAWTFGTNSPKAADAPDAGLEELVDFYVAQGEDNFRSALQEVWNLTNQ